MSSGSAVRWASFADLGAALLYRLLRLRVDVFVVEQRCAYPELDGRDVEPSTRHGWIDAGDDPAAYLRVLDDGHARRFGRVCTAAPHRGKGLAATLVEDALARTEGPVVLDAQSHLAAWYQRYGFVAVGPEYLDDGIAHVPMRLDR